MTKKRPHQPKSSDEFRRAVSDVIPLAAKNKAALEKPRPRPIVRRDDGVYSGVDDLSDHITFEREPGQSLTFSRPGVQRQVLRDLRRGGSVIDDELDLHGLTVAQARPLLVAFLDASRRRGLRFVRVIHGKGMRSESGRAERHGCELAHATSGRARVSRSAPRRWRERRSQRAAPRQREC